MDAVERARRVQQGEPGLSDEIRLHIAKRLTCIGREI